MSIYSYNIGLVKIKPWEMIDKETNISLIVTTMINKCMQMFKLSGLPESIPQRELLRILLVNGKAVVTDVNGTLYAFETAVGGEPSVYFTPTRCIWASPKLAMSFDREIDTECILIRTDSNAIGLTPILTKYASMITEAEITLQKALINSRLIGVGTAKDNKLAESMKMFFKAIEDGKNDVIVDKMLGLDENGIQIQPIANGLNANSISQIIEGIQYLKAQMMLAVGLNDNFNMKREALNSAETNLNDDGLTPTIDDMLYNIRLGLEQVNNLYGTNITIEITSAWKNNQEAEEMTKESEENSNDNASSEGNMD